MNLYTKEAIKNGNARGMNFHVFCDQPNYIAGEHVGKSLYHSSWVSYEVAKSIASEEDNGVVYNSFGDVV